MNTFAIGSLPVHFSVAKLFTFRWQYTHPRQLHINIVTKRISGLGINVVNTSIKILYSC